MRRCGGEGGDNRLLVPLLRLDGVNLAEPLVELGRGEQVRCKAAAEVAGAGLTGGVHEDQPAKLALGLLDADVELRSDGLRGVAGLVLDELDRLVLLLDPDADCVRVRRRERVGDDGEVVSSRALLREVLARDQDLAARLHELRKVGVPHVGGVNISRRP